MLYFELEVPTIQRQPRLSYSHECDDDDIEEKYLDAKVQSTYVAICQRNYDRKHNICRSYGAGTVSFSFQKQH